MKYAKQFERFIRAFFAKWNDNVAYLESLRAAALAALNAKLLRTFYIVSTKRAGSIQHGLSPMYLLIGLAIGLAVIGVVAALSILPSGTSAGLISATSQINGFLAIIGLGVAVGFLQIAFRLGGKK